MAGLKTNVFTNLNEISESWQLDRAFEPNMSNDQREYHLSLWNDALQRAKSS
jgi:glycerol kinase